ncbi:MAG: MarR family transcriptional regulator [Saprospiraceae bacterium]|nr:MarR family transcriptional regulator [Candidatus Vicinibacter affinis]
MPVLFGQCFVEINDKNCGRRICRYPGLSSSYAFLLMTVNNKPGIQPKEISEQMQLTASTITRLIEKMEQKKLLVRESTGRSTGVFPTDKAWH